jgi:hypothetical protein
VRERIRYRGLGVSDQQVVRRMVRGGFVKEELTWFVRIEVGSSDYERGTKSIMDGVRFAKMHANIKP